VHLFFCDIFGRAETLWKFYNVVLENNGEDQLDGRCEKWRSIAQNRAGSEHLTYKKVQEACRDLSILA